MGADQQEAVRVEVLEPGSERLHVAVVVHDLPQFAPAVTRRRSSIAAPSPQLRDVSSVPDLETWGTVLNRLARGLRLWLSRTRSISYTPRERERERESLVDSVSPRCSQTPNVCIPVSFRRWCARHGVLTRDEPTTPITRTRFAYIVLDSELRYVFKEPPLRTTAESSNALAFGLRFGSPEKHSRSSQSLGTLSLNHSPNTSL